MLTALNPETAARQQRLLSWINTHDCGVQPCGIARADGAMIIQVAFVEADGSEGVEVTTVHTMAEARDALGY